jgi:Ca2+-binding RTX toxin-like protein
VVVRNNGLRTAAVEALEGRRMLSATIVDRVLVIEGGRRADTVEVAREGKKSVRVTVNGERSTFALKRFGTIRIVLGRGTDIVVVGTNERQIGVPAGIDAGGGNDTIYSGAGNDSVDCGAGDDFVASYTGADRVRGGDGADTLLTGDGADTLYGDAGDDVVHAGGGDDLAYGGAGDDELWDEPGTDLVYGNKGNDRYVVNANRKEFKDRAKGESTEAEPAGSDERFRYTLAGDATLDGTVDFNDLVKLAQDYSSYDGSLAWLGGDFTYDGNVNFEDLVKLAQRYNTALPG